MSDAFFAPCNPECPVAQNFMLVNRLQWEAWTEVLPGLGEDADLSFRALARRFGITGYRVECIVRARYMLSYMPQLSRIQESEWLLDIERVCALGRVLKGVPTGRLVDVDDVLATLFTPRRPGQHLPEPAELRRAVEEMLNVEKEESPKERYQCLKYRDNSLISFAADSVTIETIDRLVRKRAMKDGIPLADALVSLILDPVKTRVVVNLFKPEGATEAYLPGTGFVTPPVDAPERVLLPASVEGYTPTDAIRAFVEARDGTCRFPGCTVPAYLCQLDHRIEYDAGGETSTANLTAVCQKHHNIKTDRRALYVLDPVSGDIHWLFADGTWEVTIPEGVMSSRWKMTVAQRLGLMDSEELSFTA